MKNRNVDTLRIYDWVKTIQDVKNQENMKIRNFSTVFHQEMNKPLMHATINGNWGEWELTAEGTGQYPIVKCYIENGTFEVDTNDGKSIYDLKDTWIKICLKIEEDQKGTYVIANKEDTLYSINHSFHFDKENTFISTLVENLFITWFKEHRDLLNQHINAYTIQSRTLNDLVLMGWDMSYATSFSNVNKMIQQQKLYPSNFEQEYKTSGIFGVHFKMEGTFDSWEITTGGDGKNVNFICKCGKDSVLINLKDEEGEPIKFSPGAYIKIQLKLQYLNWEEENEGKKIEDSTGNGDGYQVNLKVKTDYEENEESPVIIIMHKFTDDETVDIYLKATFEKWFKENIHQFKNIFSQLLLKETAKDPNFQWVKPTSVSYGVAEVTDENGKTSLDKSVFSVMSMVENRKNKNPQHTVDARLLEAVKQEKETNDTALGMDMPLFVDKWLLNGLEILQVDKRENFEKTSNGKVIQNKEKINFGKVENVYGDPVPTEIAPKKFKYGVDNNRLFLEIEDLVFEQSPGIKAHVDYKQYYDLKLQSGTDVLGKAYNNVLFPEEDENNAIIKITYIETEEYKWGKFVAEIMTGILLSVAGGFALGTIAPATKEAAVSLTKSLFKNTVGKVWKLVISIKDFIKKLLLNPQKLIEDVSHSIKRTFNSVQGIKDLSSPAVLQIVKNTSVSFGVRLMELSRKFMLALPYSLGVGAAGLTPTILFMWSEYLIKKQYSELPSINNHLANCVGAVKWPDNSEFNLESAHLQGIYLMGGRIK
ncbi:TULIP family P47-like protein [Bacillus cereus group sp. Bc222]|uniref:TULIP family P47-like protein n=1 Tax=Bacillus cereus group sp. Bc222 TaxID=3018111 RepID=UPI0022E13F3F|nr:TULIP family P47-like protein [Bacillus cereus group sp. Bc222]MDA2241746.1 TULIP family P47-like protein [Bacillus cereus group sp. Bc222]